MKLLLHICCAPCTIYPLQVLRSDDHEVCGLFYNPNIHPYREYEKRLSTLKTYAAQCNLSVTYSEDYHMEEFLRNVAFREKDRCRYCYYDRLRYSAHRAKEGRFEGFTTTLLYSTFQDHEMIKNIGKSLAIENQVMFYYRDFREGWLEGIKISKEIGIYRQPYCGCIYSEKERFCPVQ
ncbi:MAG: putative cytosolic protein [Deltaproteobacteria bacterium]|nr:putative cytosolic protein [Bacteroidota bacterium]MBS1238519.1 putative cytosolic protein [Deltaproteobacteria bacterium]